ncbi:MAG: DNA translocase FtsK, partial [Maribacter sp.]|nr:DNA translocase FtsK [Maribacter sp.]
MERPKAFHSAYSIIICTIGVFMLISIATFSPNDPPFANYPVNNPVQNYCGKVGAGLSGYLMTCLGITSYLFAFMVGALGVSLFLKKKIEILWVRIIGGILLIFSISPILGILDNFANLFSNSLETGGIIGMLAAFRLKEYLGIPGACILLTLGFMLSIMLISNKSLESCSGWVYKKIRKMVISRMPIRNNIQTITNGSPVEEMYEHEEDIVDESDIEEDDTVTDIASIPKTTGRKPKEKSSFFKRKERSMPKVKRKQFENKGYVLPPILLLDELKRYKFDSDEHVMEKASILKDTLEQFNVIAGVVGMEKGPSVTMYELELAPGTKVGKVSNLSDDIAIALKAPSIRVVAPIPGKSTIGIEVPNTHRKPVQIRELYEVVSKDIHKHTIPLLLGKDIAGYPLISDLAAMPHLLVAGTTGSGKSVCLNSIILSILLFQRPEELKLILIDPKMVEFSAFKDVPHLIAPVVTEMKKAAGILEWAVGKMDERYTLLARAGVRDLAGYNSLSDSEKQKRLDPEGDANLDDIPFFMPCMVIIIDELA